MAKHSFRGGLHPYDGKELSKDRPIIDILPGKELVFPLSQHIGAPAVPVVKKGDKVLRGQMIADAGGFVSVPIYSTVSGSVTAIEKRRVVTGDMVESIVIANDSKYEEVKYQITKDFSKLSKEDIREKIRVAGVVGMGGAGFPTHVKLSPKEPDKIDYCIANCAECEPYLTSDYRRMIEEPQKLIDGLKIILSLFDNAKGILAVEDNKSDCIEILRKLTKDEPRILVKALKTKYPQGSERQLIFATTKRAINCDMLPADAGCIVNNVDTIVAVYNAVMEGKPLMERIVTVTGDCVRKPQNYRVHIGMMYSELINEAGALRSALLCMSRDEVSEVKPSACINCGMCAQVCPGRVVPKILSDMAEHGDEEGFLAKNGMECCECGCCSYICPAKRNLTQSIKSMRKTILAKRKR